MLNGSVPAAVGPQEGTALVRGAAALTSTAWTPTRSPPRARPRRRAHELEALVRIPSISADPAHADDVDACAAAVADLMRDAGLDDVRELAVDGGHPYVVGEWTHRARRARPCCSTRTTTCNRPGYVDRWSSDPFEPRERDGRLFGRGTADDKAGAVAHVAAVRAWLDTAGELPCNVKVLVEGEEEIGSPGLGAVPHEHADALRSDVLLLADAGNWSVGTPGLTYSLRGLAELDVRVRALDGPVHSGMAGGARARPVLALAQMLATLVDEHGDPAFDGCWDDYEPPDAAERARLAALPHNDAGLRARGACATAWSSPAIPTCRSSSGSGCGPRSP